MAVRRAPRIKDHVVLGLDIGTRFIKVAELRLARGAIAVVNVAMRPTPPGVLSNSQILDPVGLGRAVREMLVLNRFSTRRVILSIAGQSSVVVRPIDLPKMTRKELTQTMKFEVERHIPFAADEVVMDYSPLVEAEDLPEDEGQMKVLLAVAQEELINAYLKMLSVAGLQAVAMDVEILAAIRALVDIHQDEGSYDRTVALVDLGACSTDISIITDGNLTFTRSVPIAGDSLTEAIADQLGRSFEEAEELKKAHGRIFIEEGFTLGAASADTAPVADLAAPAAAEPDVPAAEPVPDTPDQLTSFFSSFGAAPAAPATPATAPAANSAPAPDMFSLDDDFDVPGPLTVGTSGAAAITPMEDGPAPTFQLDEDDVDDDVPFPFRLDAANAGTPGMAVLRLDDDGDAPNPGTPVFQLDDDGVDDEPLFLSGDLSMPRATNGTPVFSLDADGDAPTFSLDAAPPAPVVLEPETPLMITPDAPAPTFSLDIPAEAEPAFSLDLPAAPEPAFSLDLPAASEPAFSLDLSAASEPAFSPEPEPPGPTGAAFTEPPAPEPEPAGAGPLFDLSSELEGQLPTFNRPTASAEPEPEPEALFSITPPAPEPVAPPTAEPATVATPLFDMGFDAGDTPAAPAAPLTAPMAAPEPLASMTPPTPSEPMTAAGPIDLNLDGGSMFDTFSVASAPAGDGDAAHEESQSDIFQRRIFESMLSTLMEMVTEIRRSLEYYTGREPDHPISRIILFGGTSRLPHIAEFISQELGLDVVIADPLQLIEVETAAQPLEYIQEVAPALPVCVGLSLRDMIA